MSWSIWQLRLSLVVIECPLRAHRFGRITRCCRSLLGIGDGCLICVGVFQFRWGVGRRRPSTSQSREENIRHTRSRLVCCIGSVAISSPPFCGPRVEGFLSLVWAGSSSGSLLLRRVVLGLD